MTQDIPQQVIDARLSIDTGTGGRYVELVERVAVPAGADTEIVELSAIGRLVQSAAGRYGAALAEVIAPLRAAILALPDGPAPDGVADAVAFQKWRHAALCLLDHLTTGNPLDFKGQPIPDAVRGRLAGWSRAAPGPNSLSEAAGPAHGYTGPPVGDAVTEVIPRLRVYVTPGDVPIEVRALAYVDRVADVWFVHDRGLDWRRTGPEGDETLHTLPSMFTGGNMVAVDPKEGRPC